MDEDEEAMMAAIGLPVGFNSSKGKKVEGNDVGTFKVTSQRIYRQYMNRRGGFNKILDQDKNVERNTKGKKKDTGKDEKQSKPAGKAKAV